MANEIVSEDRVKLIVTHELAQYEREIGNVRHTENSKKLGDFSVQMVNFGLNMAEFVGVLRGVKIALGFLGALCTLILLLLTYLGTHPVAHSALAVHENVVVSQLQNAAVE